MGKGKGIFGIASVVLGILGVGATVVGAIEKKKADKINQNAAKIKEEAIEKYDQSYKSTCSVLNKLGKEKLNIINSFERFSNDMEMLQNKPEFKNNYSKNYELSSISIKDFKTLSTKMQFALSAAGGATAGALIGMAAFGISAFIISPAIFCGGVVLCFKGHKLKKQAIENEAQAKKLKQDVDAIEMFYRDLSKIANHLRDNMRIVNKKYIEHLESFESTLFRTNNWSCFSDAEKQKTENLVMLAKILYTMCKIEIVVRDTSTQTERINYYDVFAGVEDAKNAVASC